MCSESADERHIKQKQTLINTNLGEAKKSVRKLPFPFACEIVTADFQNLFLKTALYSLQKRLLQIVVSNQPAKVAYAYCKNNFDCTKCCTKTFLC